ncbi:MAG: hypothetical protein DRJ50_13520 [Actinobacteria bacterium]|nr:MAG: hypothetical protein DRJ50_13520 [Actinomycetota bacterium]
MLVLREAGPQRTTTMSKTTKTEPEAALPLPIVHNGTFTVSHPTEGHYTLKIHTAQKGKLAGRRIISQLFGPNNETDFKGVAFWEDGEKRAFVWRKHQHPHSPPEFPLDGYHWSRNRWSKVEKKIAVFLCLSLRKEKGYWHGAGYSLLAEGRCVVCNRKLTTPESIRNGIGPTCAARAGRNT